MKSETTRISPLLRWRNICFAACFALLLCERLAGGILGIFMGGQESMLYSDTFIPKLVHPLTLLSLVAGIAVMGKQWVVLFHTVGGKDLPLDFTRLSAAIGRFLFSGMMHTGFLLLPVQFASYGVLAAGLILHAVEFKNGVHAKERTLAISYIISFSMTVPVVYDTALEGLSGTAFIIAELLAVCYLVAAFAAMTGVFLKTGRCGANPAVMVVMLLLVGAVFFIRISEYQNWLVAAFAVITLIIWIMIAAMNRRSIRFTANPFDFRQK